MNWVTWENVGVDRIGCAWLIRKLIDPQAQFQFIPRGAPLPPNAEAFDVPGVPSRLTVATAHSTQSSSNTNLRIRSCHVWQE
jgi:hypothetical protein